MTSEIPENPKEDEPFGLGCALEYFSEFPEVLETIENLRNIITWPRSKKERAYERLTYILNQYIEQPHLLDAHLDEVLEKLIQLVRQEQQLEIKHAAFKCMFILINVRGYKVVVRHLPHEVADFEPVLRLLEAQDPNDTENWTSRYVLLLWMSIIVMIPFQLSRLDDDSDANKKTVMMRVLEVCQRYAVVPDKCRDAAAYLAAKFVTRYDVKDQYLSSFFDWACTSSTDPSSNIFVKYGALASIAMILKHGKREDLLPYADRLLRWITNADFKSECGANIQKLVYKIIQRIGMTFLAPRVAAWRYQRGNRCLATNLSAGDGSKKTLTMVAGDQESKELEEEEFSVPDEIEEVIDQLIQGLGSADSVVRWSAAKGVGRITSRLPKDLADDVVGSVLDIFTRRERDSAWHGGCLALAELGRRGLLLPQRLPEVVPVVLKALVYDEPRGYSSVGSHIRDAACYVCWSFARAYETDVLKPFVRDIAGTLLIVACFDKEINCRRAASAAFQENVGRQGTFPHGIEILTAADFFSVSVRSNAYLNVSVFVAGFEEYSVPLVEHLIYRKVDHWDCSIRELTAKALHNLTPKTVDYVVSKALPELFLKTETIDLNSRHGAVLAIGEVLLALSEIAEERKQKLEDIIGDDLLKKCENLITEFNDRHFFRGMGGELMKQAFSSFIENCSKAHVPFHNKPVIDLWFRLLNDCLSYEVPLIRSSAISALPYFFEEYYNSPSRRQHCKDIINAYMQKLRSNDAEVIRMGHSLALGALPKFMLEMDPKGILGALVEATKITPNTFKWSESRRDSVKAITSIFGLLDAFDEDVLESVFGCMLDGLEEYTQDNRGDIGAWMREASMVGLETITLILAKKQRTALNEARITAVITSVAQQAVEKIDRTRAVAGKVFYSLIHSELEVPNIPNHDSIKEIFRKQDCDLLIWNSAAKTFPIFVKLLEFETYTYRVLLGLICSVGGMTETLVKNSSSSLFSYLNEQLNSKGENEIKRICDIIYRIFCDNQKIDRITVPIFRFLDKLMGSGCIDCIIKNPNSDFPQKIFKLIQLEINGCKDIYKLIDAINVMCQFIQIKAEICKTALVQLSILLCHRQSYVRRSTANRFYESLLVNGEESLIPPENLEEVKNILISTDWEEAVDVIRPVRNTMCSLMDVRVPVMKKKI